MNNNDFLLLVSKNLSGEVTESETKELELIISANTEFAQQYKLLKQFWAEESNTNQVFVEDGLQKVLQRLELPFETPVKDMEAERKRKSVKWFYFRVAVAAGAAIILTTALFLKSTNNNKTAPVEISKLEKKQNSKGTKSIIELSDGSKVWLNADSKIQYPPLFAGRTREIYLDGEAFFEVAKNAQKPFIIHLSNGTVKVLGTSFNVRAYNNEKVVETSVATGKVAFIPKYNSNKKQDTIFITPNNKVQYHFTDEKIALMPTVVTEDKAWTEGKLIFKAMTLQAITTELERNFGKKAVFLDDEARQYVLTGSFQNNTLAEIMYYLSLSKTKKIYYRITSNELRIALDETKL
ncbi:MAG: FecR domain-containing protein [Chitinophagaceae bacterium]|nr:FecR domain-containing protein [Chitinophagaceae bacterium]